MQPQTMAYDIPSFCSAYSIGRTRTYQEIKEGRLRIIKIGKQTLISAHDAPQPIEL